MLDFFHISLWANVSLFAASALAILFSGIKLADIADRLADRTGLGEAMTGALFLGASTSLPGLITSVTAAFDGYPELAISNAAGGIAAQTAFLALADITYKKANLEHAAASPENILQGTLLVSLLTLPLLAVFSPNLDLFGIHPATPFIFAAYVYGMQLVSRARVQPMWRPHRTPETREDKPDRKAQKENLAKLWTGLGIFGGILVFSGWFVARNGAAISEKTGLSETAVGGFFTAVSTSLPELVTAIAAVRQGALTLAVGDIIGGNAFDTLFISVADIAYRDGSIYHALSERQIFLFGTTILLTGILLMGLVRREKRGIANIGFESFLILVFYCCAVFFLFMK